MYVDPSLRNVQAWFVCPGMICMLTLPCHFARSSLVPLLGRQGVPGGLRLQLLLPFGCTAPLLLPPRPLLVHSLACLLENSRGPPVAIWLRWAPLLLWPIGPLLARSLAMLKRGLGGLAAAAVVAFDYAGRVCCLLCGGVSKRHRRSGNQARPA